MKLSDEQIGKFQSIYLAEFGVPLPREKAIFEANSLILLLGAAHFDRSKPRKDDTDERPTTKTHRRT